ncbi:hypothetical protein Y1Q_0019731 [Alligator mississippiensis]|uniref:Transmembrane protein n=1 Tax=Alligator mississippiensis TaxID=8496 RepID=A0A151PF73_ALLMI|nr:hypothetical protein Y1Q_0019731 [Alligator mississippiensis]
MYNVIGCGKQCSLYVFLHTVQQQQGSTAYSFAAGLQCKESFTNDSSLSNEKIERIIITPTRPSSNIKKSCSRRDKEKRKAEEYHLVLNIFIHGSVGYIYMIIVNSLFW